jgi:uncharacterized protein (TIGR00290 family)
MLEVPIVCSWSGGKDSCLALWRSLQTGASIRYLATMLTEDGQRSRSHGLSLAVLEAQAAAIGVPLLTRAATWDQYEPTFVELLCEAKDAGVTAAVFGDIDIPRHRQWEESVCAQAGLTASLPLWQQDRLALLEEFWSAGFACRIVVARDGVTDRKYLGRVLDRALAEELSRAGIDACGENGEFHTVVTSGPIFKVPLSIELRGQVLRSGCWFQDLAVAGMATSAFR